MALTFANTPVSKRPTEQNKIAIHKKTPITVEMTRTEVILFDKRAAASNSLFLIIRRNVNVL